MKSHSTTVRSIAVITTAVIGLFATLLIRLFSPRERSRRAPHRSHRGWGK
ncbi:hypothetical protein LY39_03401 [Roseinatronobacter bogoriensis subsp. barguzinensis]|nr:hypothetical protein [Rhodobaca bogoriensis DSM 18756]TDW34346.1 hypothetical protein LY39_03401 [Rhodobaca barguzinensis]TDY67063.1 hypothetical protein EV660_10864 [Rhodobaca bogoriensis DSM 18756]